MPSHKTLIFHIGDHKTGSTSIQLAFAEGRIALNSKKLLYPAQLASNALKKQFMNWAKASSEADKEEASRPLAKLAHRIRTTDADYVVVSAEEFEWVPPALFKRVVNHFFRDCADEIRVIAYVRPHAPRIISSFCERTKIGGTAVLQQTLADFAKTHQEKGTFTYHGRFAKWREHFGAAFLLRPMIRAKLIEGSVVTDFIQHAFPGEPYTLDEGNSANESLDLVDLMRLKVLQRHFQQSSQMLRHQIGWEFLRLTGHMPAPAKRQKLKLHKALANDLSASYRADAQAMDRDFFNGEPTLETELATAITTAQKHAQSVEPADYLSDAEMRGLQIMAGFLESALSNDSVNWPQFFHQKRVDDTVQARKAHLAAS